MISLPYLRHRIIISILFLYSVSTYSQKISISVYNDKNIETAVFSPVKGKYKLFGDSVFIKNIDKSHAIYVSLTENSLVVRDVENKIGRFHTIHFKGIALENMLKVRPVSPALSYRMYDDDFFLSEKYDRLMIINQVNFEHYTAGVIETECGSGQDVEFYKAMAVITRTYALKYLHKHKNEGFQLCDGVHCQAYKHHAIDNKVVEAVNLTHGEVLLGNDTSLITAAFFSNCGGETANSEMVWLKSSPYLKSIKDPYCSAKPNARWSKTISIEKWKDYLAKQGVNPKKINNRDIRFQQKHRKKYYKINGHTILLQTIRKDWNLPSTFFEIKTSWNELIMEGRGYGHGVGLCQEGSMVMARKGFDYKEIINFYYQNVEIINFFELERLLHKNNLY
jgi:stage II sporulation protein D